VFFTVGPTVRLDLTAATIVFDLDGTIVDTAPDLAAASNYVFGLIGLDAVSPLELHPYISRGSRAMIEAGLRLHGVMKTNEEVTRLHELFFPYYANNIATLSRPFEGVPELLDALKQAGARLAVCTNKFEALSRSLLEQLGLASRFAVIAGRDTFSVFKPDPGHLTGTIERAGGRRDCAVMVGDSEVDIATALAAGLPSIGVTFGYTPRPMPELGATAVIDHFRDFPAALEKVLSRHPL
jgi:phosphoglycolate phosphatase